jgi:uncharacterized protein YegP (UPF0339 family)
MNYLRQETSNMAGRYELRKGGMIGHSVWYFVLKTSEGRTLATSELYDTLEAALADIAVMRKNAPARAVNDLTEYRVTPLPGE